MKLTIRGYIPSSMIDWPGKCSCMILLPGCNFNCPYCHSNRMARDWRDLPIFDVDTILTSINSYDDFIDGVVISGGEPTIHEDLPELCQIIKKKTGRPIKLNTNGSNFRMLCQLAIDNLVDLVSMDVKTGLHTGLYGFISQCGKKNLIDEVKSCINFLKRDPGVVDHEFKITAFPPAIDKEIQRACLIPWLYRAKRVVIQQFHPELCHDLMARKVKPWSGEQIEQFASDITIDADLAQDCEVRM